MFGLKLFLSIIVGPLGTARQYTPSTLANRLKKRFEKKGFSVETTVLNSNSQTAIMRYEIKNSNKNILGHYTSPANDIPPESNELSLGTNTLNDVLSQTLKPLPEDNSTILAIPLAQIGENRNHWTLLLINKKEGKATLIDPKYATPKGIAGEKLPWLKLDRGRYPYRERIYNVLSHHGIKELEIRYLGVQHYYNRWKCGPHVVKQTFNHLRQDDPRYKKKYQSIILKSEKANEPKSTPSAKKPKLGR